MPSDSAASWATLDDPSQQGGFTTWADGAGGARVATSHLRLSGLVCAACAGLIEQALAAEPGVQHAEVSYAARRARVSWRPEATAPSRLLQAVERAGYGAEPDLALSARAQRQRVQRASLWRLFVAGFCTMQVMMYAAPAYVATPGSLAPDLLRLLQWASWLLTVPVLLFSAAPLFSDAWAGLRRGQVRMDLPVVIGLVVAFVASTGATFSPGGVFGHEVYFDSVTMFVCLLLAGRHLALLASQRAAASLDDALLRLPADVTRIGVDGSLERVPAHALRTGDQLRVVAGEAFAADGVLLEGQTQCDEALLTGESLPVAKQCGDSVVAGSLNLGGAVTLRVDRLGADTRFAAIVALMRNAATQRPALLRTADRVAVPFLWGVLLLAAGAAAVWSVIDPGRAVWVFVSVLIVTCPCALSLAAPSALLAAVGALARRGVLVQHIDALEALARVDSVVFDKTGTLTSGQLQFDGAQRLPAAERLGLDLPGLLASAASLAQHSVHPVARALAAGATMASAPTPATGAQVLWSDITEHPGQGLRGKAADGSAGRLGAPAWVAAGEAKPPLAADASHDRLWYGDQRGALASFSFSEAIKPDALIALDALRADGVAVALLSGDAPTRVRDVAQALQIGDATGATTPEAKLSHLRALQAKGHCVAMVGDGLNDAPVIACADVSFAFAQGAAITQAGADIVLLSPRLGDVVMARATARQALRVLRQNIVWAVAYNAVCVPLALLGWFPPWAAGLGMACSSMAVVLNALRVGARPLSLPSQLQGPLPAALPAPLAAPLPTQP